MKNSLLQRALPVGVVALSLLTGIAGAKLVAWYPLDESQSAPDVVDEIVADNDATMVGFDTAAELSLIARGNLSAKQNLGSSYQLTKGGGLNLGTDSAIQPTDKFTISFWLQPLTLDGFDRIIESAVGNGNGQDGIRIDTGSGGTRFRVQLRDASGANQGADHTTGGQTTVLKNDGTWYFCAFRYDSAGVDNPAFQLTMIEYTGDPVDEAAVTAATSGPATSNIGPLHAPHAMETLVGIQNPEGTGNNSLNAGLDEVAFYDNSDGAGVLTDQQLADVYNFGPSGVELITDFASNVDSVAPGNPATLSWTVNEPFDTLVLDDGNGNTTDLAPRTTAGSGTFDVTPAETTTYSLRATRGDTANVSQLTILAGAAPAISSFTSSAPLIQVGGSVDLSWSVAGADSLQLDPGATDVSALTTINVSPTVTTTYTFSATNAFGTSTAELTVAVIAGPVPAHRYDAATAANTDELWIDEVAASDFTSIGAVRGTPLAVPSDNTNLIASYSTGGGVSGGSTGSFQYSDFTAELWVRPGALVEEHEVVFESGGGQNGIGLLLNEDGFRFIGSAGDVRTLDVTIPIDGLNVDDFIQVVFSTSADSDAFEAAVRDTFDNVRTASETANVIIGGNGAGIFIMASGGLGGINNLGGRTEDAAALPAVLNGFAGEIALVNIYDRLLDSTEIQAAFDSVASTIDPPVETPFAITKIEHSGNTVTLTWNSIVDHLYDAQFSTALQPEWFNLDDPITSTTSETTKTFNIPPNRERFFLRIIDLGAD